MLTPHKARLALSMLAIFTIPAFSATVTNLRHQPMTLLHPYVAITSKQAILMPQESLQEIHRDYDFNGTLHIRFQQTVMGYTILGSDMVLHIPKQAQTNINSSLANIVSNAPKTTMNGTLYQNLAIDLRAAPNFIFQTKRSEEALNQAIALYQPKARKQHVTANKKSELVVYIDNKSHKAHWAYHIQFSSQSGKKTPAKLNYVIDAITLDVYQTWNSVLKFSDVAAGGYGGNEKIGRLSYDGQPNQPSSLPSFMIKRDDKNKICYLENDEIEVKDMRKDFAVVSFPCVTSDTLHNNLFWDANLSQVNGGFSPANDVFYAVKNVNDMYKSWYGIPIVSFEKSQKISAAINFNDSEDGRNGDDVDEATWGSDNNGNSIALFGNGKTAYYPLTSVDAIAHEFGHGFTEQHSALSMNSHAIALNESFADMTSKAAEFYANGNNDNDDWRIGAKFIKAPDQKALRFMDHPTLDCEGREPGNNCSIEYFKDFPDVDYTDSRYGDPHFHSGITNRAFYLIVKAWEDKHDALAVKKAYDVIMQANRNYWVATTTLPEAACGIVAATKDYGYPVDDVIEALNKVGLNTSSC